MYVLSSRLAVIPNSLLMQVRKYCLQMMETLLDALSVETRTKSWFNSAKLSISDNEGIRDLLTCMFLLLKLELLAITIFLILFIHSDRHSISSLSILAHLHP